MIGSLPILGILLQVQWEPVSFVSMLIGITPQPYCVNSENLPNPDFLQEVAL